MAQKGELMNMIKKADISLQQALNNPNLPQAKKLLNQINIIHKEIMIEDDLSNIKQMLNETSSDNKVVTKYIKDEINGIVFIGRKNVPLGPRKDDQEVEWFFRGFCTYQEFQDEFAAVYKKFKSKYWTFNFYEEEDYDLYLEVSGGLIGDKLLIDFPTKQYWNQRRVLVSCFGVNSKAEMISGDAIQLNNLQKFRQDVNQIKENGGPKNFQEARKMKMSNSFASMWLGEYNQFYQE